MDIFADIMIVLMALTLLATIGITGYSVYHSLQVNKRKKVENGVPVGLIGWCTLALLLVVALPCLIIGSFTDMCIITALVMLAVAAGTVIYSKLTTARLRK